MNTIHITTLQAKKLADEIQYTVHAGTEVENMIKQHISIATAAGWASFNIHPNSCPIAKTLGDLYFFFRSAGIL